MIRHMNGLLVFIEMKQFFFFWKKKWMTQNNQSMKNGKWGFFESVILIFFFKKKNCFISMKTSSLFKKGIIYFCTMDGFFRILEKTNMHMTVIPPKSRGAWGMYLTLQPSMFRWSWIMFMNIAKESSSWTRPKMAHFCCWWVWKMFSKVGIKFMRCFFRCPGLLGGSKRSNYRIIKFRHSDQCAAAAPLSASRGQATH